MAENTTAAKKTTTIYLDGVNEKFIRRRQGTSARTGKPYDFTTVSISGIKEADNGWGNFALGKYDKVLDARNKNGQIIEGRKNVALNSSDSWKYRVSVKQGDSYVNIEKTAKEIKAIYDAAQEAYKASRDAAQASSDAAAEAVTETPNSGEEFVDIPEGIDGVLFQ